MLGESGGGGTARDTLGWIDQPADLTDVIEPRFARQAVEALGGPYNRN